MRSVHQIGGGQSPQSKGYAMNQLILAQAEAYRRRAQEVRVNAQLQKQQSKEALLQLASGYDSLAASLERMATRCRYDVAPWRIPSLADRSGLREG